MHVSAHMSFRRTKYVILLCSNPVVLNKAEGKFHVDGGVGSSRLMRIRTFLHVRVMKDDRDDKRTNEGLIPKIPNDRKNKTRKREQERNNEREK